MKGSDVHRLATRLLSAALALVGVVLVVESLTLGGIQLARLLMGILFVAAGSGRLYLQARRSRDA